MTADLQVEPLMLMRLLEAMDGSLERWEWPLIQLKIQNWCY
jgi:hypothetical protein